MSRFLGKNLFWNLEGCQGNILFSHETTIGTSVFATQTLKLVPSAWIIEMLNLPAQNPGWQIDMGSSKSYTCVHLCYCIRSDFSSWEWYSEEDFLKKAFNIKCQLSVKFSSSKYSLKNSFVCITEASCWLQERLNQKPELVLWSLTISVINEHILTWRRLTYPPTND